MKCIVCGKKIAENDELCGDCSKFMDMAYKKRPEDKENALKAFRRESDRRNKKCN